MIRTLLASRFQPCPAIRVTRSRRQATRRKGFSLLEVLLTMSMAVVLMGLVNWAFTFYTRDMNSSNFDIQQTQVAAALLQMIENDLRATLHPEPIDMSALEEALSSVGGQGGGGAAGAETGDPGDLSAAGIDDLEEIEETPEEVTTGVAVLQTPGLIGDQYQLQIDASRLPRLEEYNALLDADTTNLNDVPSDLKTIAYYVQAPETAGGVTDPLDALNTNGEQSLSGGLVRRSLDRSITKYAAENGNLSSLNQTGELLGPEVVGIEFQYWDGVTWQIEWSSDELEELPLAVRIDLQMKNPNAEEAGLAETDQNAIRTFTHIVRLQMARPIEEDEEILDEEVVQ